MKKLLFIGMVDGYGIGRKTCAAFVTFRLERTNRGLAFAASGEVWNHINTDIILGGQCFEELSKLCSDVKGYALFQRIKKVWERYHLNDMRGGCEHQRAAKWEDRRIPVAELPDSTAGRDKRGIVAIHVYPPEAKGQDFVSDSKIHEKGLLTKPCPVCGYKYGTAWLYEPLPEEVVKEILSW